MRKIWIFSFLFLVFVGCSTISGNAKKRAAYDFNCSEDKIQLNNISGDTYVANGCGRKQIYTCRATSINAFKGYDYSCVPEGGSEVQEAAAPLTPAPNAALQHQMMMQPAMSAPAGGF